MESTPQDTVEPRVPVRVVDEPFVTPRSEEGSSQELQLSKETDNDSDLMDILPDDTIEFRPVTTRDEEMSEVTTESDLPSDAPASDPMEDIVTPPPEPQATRTPSWKRELAASTSKRERTATSYGLRHRPSKKSL